MPDFITENGVLQKYSGKESHVVIPYGIDNIENRAFENCDFIEKITIPSSIKSIGYAAFKGCKNLKEVHINDMSAWCEIKFDSSIYSNPLFYAKKLYLNGKIVEHLVIPDDVTTIKKGTFSYCSCIVSVTIPQTVTVIEERAFSDCYSISRVNIAGITQWLNIEFKDRDASPLCNKACLYINGDPVLNIDIPDGVTSIGNYAFSGYHLLSSVKISDSVTKIGKGAFMYCESLSEIHIPDSVTRIGSEAFESCTSLKKLSLPNSVDKIESYSFAGCESLVDIDIPPSVISIEDGAFIRCVSLECITIPDSVTQIGRHAFENCSSLKEISLPEGIIKIEDDTFKKCTELKSIHLPESVSVIGEDAFYYCRSLAEIYISASVTEILRGAFGECTALEGVYIKDIAHWCSVRFYNERSNPLFYAHNLYLNGEVCTNLDIPVSVTNISDRCFYNCRCLECINIPPSVEKVGNYAFEGCTSLKEVHITDKKRWFAIDFGGNYSNPLSLGAELYFNSNPVAEAELNAQVDKYIPKYLDSWRIDVIFEIDMYNYTHSYVEKSFKFKKDDVVIKNGMIVGFNFYGAFVSLLNADKRMNPPEAVVDMMGEPSCRYYRYNVVMKLTKK